MRTSPFTAWVTRAKQGLRHLRQRALTMLASTLYGQPMRVTVPGQVALAGAVLLWYLHNGSRHFVMLRTDNGDGKARFLSSLGLNRHPDMTTALAVAMKLQLGDVFTHTIKSYELSADRVAAAPLLTYIDDAAGGVSTPVQSLVWIIQVSPHTPELIHTPQGMQAVVVPEFILNADEAGDKVSPTHRMLWQSAKRYFPKIKKADVTTVDSLEDNIRDITSGSRIIH